MERVWIELDVLDLIEICVARFIAISQGRTTGDFSVWYDGDGLSVAVVLRTRDYLKSSAPGHCPNDRVENVEHIGCLDVAEGDDGTGCHQGYMMKRESGKVKVENINSLTLRKGAALGKGLSWIACCDCGRQILRQRWAAKHIFFHSYQPLAYRLCHSYHRMVS